MISDGRGGTIAEDATFGASIFVLDAATAIAPSHEASVATSLSDALRQEHVALEIEVDRWHIGQLVAPAW